MFHGIVQEEETGVDVYIDQGRIKDRVRHFPNWSKRKRLCLFGTVPITCRSHFSALYCLSSRETPIWQLGPPPVVIQWCQNSQLWITTTNVKTACQSYKFSVKTKVGAAFFVLTSIYCIVNHGVIRVCFENEISVKSDDCQHVVCCSHLQNIMRNKSK